MTSNNIETRGEDGEEGFGLIMPLTFTENLTCGDPEVIKCMRCHFDNLGQSKHKRSIRERLRWKGRSSSKSTRSAGEIHLPLNEKSSQQQKATPNHHERQF